VVTAATDLNGRQCRASLRLTCPRLIADGFVKTTVWLRRNNESVARERTCDCQLPWQRREMQVVGEMMMRHIERDDQLTDWLSHGMMLEETGVTEFDELLSAWQILTEPWECRIANSELRLEPFYQNVLTNGINDADMSNPTSTVILLFDAAYTLFRTCKSAVSVTKYNWITITIVQLTHICNEVLTNRRYRCWLVHNVSHFTRATLCIARSLPSCGVRPSICMSHDGIVV